MSSICGSRTPRFLTNNQIDLVIQPIQAANQAANQTLDRKLSYSSSNKADTSGCFSPSSAAALVWVSLRRDDLDRALWRFDPVLDFFLAIQLWPPEGGRLAISACTTPLTHSR